MSQQKASIKNSSDFTIEGLVKSVFLSCKNYSPYECGHSCKNYAGTVDRDAREVALRSPVMNIICARCSKYAGETDQAKK